MDYEFFLFALAFALIPLIPAVIIGLLDKKKCDKCAHSQNNIEEQLTAFAVHLQKRGAFRDDLCMDFEHEAQSFIEMQNNKEL